MAKATRYGGASLTEAESADPKSPQPARVRRYEVGPIPRQQEQEDTSSPGNSSKQSTVKDQKSDEENEPSRRQPARTTASPSNPQDEEEVAATAHSTGTAGRKTPAKRARTRSTDEDEFGDFE
jgi:hypothetical protein